jgi:hypothetical protein
MLGVPASGDTLSPTDFFFNCRFRTKMPTLDLFFIPIMHVSGRKQFPFGDRVRIQNAVSKRCDDKGTIS